MALQPTLSQRPLPAGSLAMMPTPDDFARHPVLQKYVRIADLPTGPVDWFFGWGLLNEAGYGHELWLGADVIAALAEWRELWGGAPCIAVPRPTRQHISSSDMYTPEWAAALAASIANTMPDEPPTSPMIPPAAPPQDLQDNRDPADAGYNRHESAPREERGDVAGAIAAIAGKLAATPENIQAAAKAKFDDDGPGPDFAPEAEAWLDRFLEDVRDGLSDFDQRKNKYGVVLIRTRIWLRKASYDIYLEREGLPHGVIVCTQAPTGAWVPTVRRDEIREWLKLKPGPSAKDVPAATSRAAALGLPATGAALDEIGEYARNAPREDTA